MRILFILLLCFHMVSCNAQGDGTAYVNKIMEMCPGADIIELEPKDNYVEIEYLCKKKVYETGLSYNLNILYTETEATIDKKTLKAIHKKLEKKYYGWTIDEFDIVKMPDTSFYKAEILRDGVEENVYFTLTGKYYKTKNVVVNEAWNIASLEKNKLYNQAPYQFSRPHKTWVMPEVLKEISGIALANERDVFCVQDETGVVFKYNIQDEELSGMYRFTDVGDFEDITVQGEMLHVLRSDGTIFSLNHTDYTGHSESRTLPLNSLDIEGLFFDPAQNQLLVACKDPLIHGESSKRYVFGFHKNKYLSPKTELVIDLEGVNTFFKENYPEIDTRFIKVNPSAVSIHPITGEMYILSASNRFIAVYANHRLKSLYPLAEELFFKPEGLSFAPNGDLYIATEGNKKGYVDGQIHYFKWNRATP